MAASAVGKVRILSSMRGLIAVMLLALGIAGCGKKPGHDKTGYLLATKLHLSDAQAKQVSDILDELERRRDTERAKHAGDSAALLQAARARFAEERARITAVLDDKQRIGFEEMMAPYYEVNDKAVVFSERLGLDRATMKKIDPIVAQAPGREEAQAALAGTDPALTKAFIEKTEGIHRGVEQFLNDQQKKQFRAMVHEQVAGLKAPQPTNHE